MGNNPPPHSLPSHVINIVFQETRRGKKKKKVESKFSFYYNEHWLESLAPVTNLGKKSQGISVAN